MRHRLRRLVRQTFSSLKVHNYRLYFTGQSISLVKVSRIVRMIMSLSS